MKLHRGNFDSNLLFLQKVLPKESLRILEIGSGRGALVNALQEMGHQITGTEVNSEYMQYAKETYGLDLARISTDSPKLPFENESFDVVVSFDVFEHIPDTDAHLQEVTRVLVPQGKYLLSTPNKITNIPFEIIKEKSLTKYKEYHCSLHTYNQMKKRFQKNGMTIRFEEIPVVTEFFLQKIKKYFGIFGLGLVKVLQPDRWPQWARTNFYVVAEKK